MRLRFLILVLFLAASPRARALDGGLQLGLPVPVAANGDTRCERCHVTQSWDQAAFNHDKTGFVLRGAHEKASCKECHQGDLSQPISRACAGCHQDPHRGELGQQCQGCHAEQSWAPLFDAEAHRRTNFPLTGRHAFIPCTECHIATANRSFSRDTVECVNCHQADYNSTAASQVNHAQLGFGTRCADCHSGVTWLGARYVAHDSCFEIVGGPHGRLQCLSCHTKGLGGAANNSQCTSAPFSCTSCHTHACSVTAALHPNVPGYECKDQKCYACHTIKSAP